MFARPTLSYLVLLLFGCSSQTEATPEWPLEAHSSSNSYAIRMFSDACLANFPNLEKVRGKAADEGWVSGSGKDNWLIGSGESETYIQIGTYEGGNATFTDCVMAFSYQGIESELQEIKSQLGLLRVVDERSSGPVKEQMWASKYTGKMSKIMIAQASVGGSDSMNITISRREKN